MALFPLIAVLFATGVDVQPPMRAAHTLAALGAQPLADALADARRALDRRDLDAAIVRAAVASARAPESYEAVIVLGLAHFRNGEPELAVAPFVRAGRLNPTSATARFNLASALYKCDRLLDAEKRYLEAAALDDKVAALALYNAALAALDAGEIERALAHLEEARRRADAAGQTKLVASADELRSSIRHRSSNGVSDEVRALAREGKSAILAHRYADAVVAYRRALEVATKEGAPPADRAELHFAHGHALYRSGKLTEAARAFEAALALTPKEAEYHYLLGLVHFDAGADADAKSALKRALALGLPAYEATRANEILRGLQHGRGVESSRFFFELRVGAGYDTNVPQSGVVLTANKAAGASDAPFLQADLDLFSRPLGNARNGFSVEYRFGQIAYLSEALDPYSLQEHDLTLSGAWTPTPRLTLELGADGYLLFAGVQTFGPFGTGVSGGPRITIREPHNFETRLRYQHVLKFSLDPNYAYLAGNRDEAGITEVWRDPKDRISLGYLFADENIGVQQTFLKDIELPLAKPVTDPTCKVNCYNPDAVYFIPYSYLGHEVTGSVQRDLPKDFRGTLTLRYEHRDYAQTNYIFPPSGRTPGNIPIYSHRRRDDRFSGDVSMRHPLGKGFEIELAYTFILNRSTINNHDQSSPFDFDDKNYMKHVILLNFAYVY